MGNSLYKFDEVWWSLFYGFEWDFNIEFVGKMERGWLESMILNYKTYNVYLKHEQSFNIEFTKKKMEDLLENIEIDKLQAIDIFLFKLLSDHEINTFPDILLNVDWYFRRWRKRKIW